jgi:hypothetical protein
MWVPALQGVPDAVVDQAVLFAPGGRPSMKLRHRVRMGPPETGPQEIAEQMMEAVPATLLVEGNEEQVGAFQLFEHLLAIGIPGESVAELAAEPLQDGGPEQEGPHPLWLALEHLLAQVVEHVAMGSTEAFQECVWVGSPLK